MEQFLDVDKFSEEQKTRLRVLAAGEKSAAFSKALLDTRQEDDMYIFIKALKRLEIFHSHNPQDSDLKNRCKISIREGEDETTLIVVKSHNARVHQVGRSSRDVLRYTSDDVYMYTFEYGIPYIYVNGVKCLKYFPFQQTWRTYPDRILFDPNLESEDYKLK